MTQGTSKHWQASNGVMASRRGTVVVVVGAATSLGLALALSSVGTAPTFLHRGERALSSVGTAPTFLHRGERALSVALQYAPRAAGMASGVTASSPPAATARPTDTVSPHVASTTTSAHVAGTTTSSPPATAAQPTDTVSQHIASTTTSSQHIASTTTSSPVMAPSVLGEGRLRTVWNRPIHEVWPGRNAWSPALEQDYGRFVYAIGRGFASRRCHRLDDCLLNPTVNPLYRVGDVRLGLHPDCADLAYILRGYFAFKHDLPFGWVRAMGGDRGDPRYLMAGTAVAWSQWTRFATPRAVFAELPNHVHSGMFRLSAKVEEGDTYAVRIDRDAVRPGTNFYDTDGHVLVVYDVDAAGDVYLIDGHPDGSITHKRMNDTFVAGIARWGGGFRNWRPQHLEDGVVRRARNAELPDHDPRTQYDRAHYVVDGVAVRYDAWVRSRLAAR